MNKLENTPQDTTQQLSFPVNSRQQVTFGPVDTVSVTQTSKQVCTHDVVLLLQDYNQQRNHIALISSDKGEVHITQQGKFVTVEVVRILIG
ncbi:hypothetical protein K7432_017609 [Basidiobolus ranarum]|uniref:Uncharacterized protein n=1 Tax=Basidiobolus ranarum TaxID=34480 RepID=A0ABR2WD60_9FUNG